MSAQDWSPRFSLCALCQKPAKKWVSYISRRTRRVIKRQPLCDEHVEQELELATTGLSMVDIDIQPYP